MSIKRGGSAAQYDGDHPDGPRFHFEAPLEDAPGWYVYALFLVQDGHLVIGELRIFPGDPATRHRMKGGRRPAPIGEWQNHREDIDVLPIGGLTSSVLRTVRTGELLAHAHAKVRDHASFPDPLPAATALADAPLRVGRAGRGDLFYARWAAWYCQEIGGHAPVAVLAARHGLKREQVRDILHEARRRGLLSRGRKGAASGALTEKAQRLLREGEEGT